MRRWSSSLTLTAAALVLTACTSGGSEGEQDPTADFSPVAAPAVAVPLAAELSGPVAVGVVVTGSGARGEGAEYASLAAGARVAEFRLDEDGTDRVTLTVVDDGGTSDGAVAATQQLVDADVSGIVYASSGPHLDAALEVAAAGGTAVLLPYDSRDSISTATAWRTGPSDQQIAEHVSALLADRGRARPMVLTAEGAGGPLAVLADPARQTLLTAGDALPGQVASAAAALAGGTADSVLVAASAETAAETVAALQGQAANPTVVLSPSALAPAFAARLTDLGSTGTATTAGQFLTVGPAVTDATGTEGVVRFLAAVRLAAQDDALPALTGADSFATAGAATADVRSHDAVLSLVAAASVAGSVEPAEVLAALQDLTVDAGDGLAGPALTFDGVQALPDDGVAVLQATTRGMDRGVAEASPALSWFALPDGTR